MKNWKNTIIFDDKTIYDAIKNLEKTGLQIILVTNKKNNFLGTITDGDIRSGILKGYALDKSIMNILNKKPIITKKNITNELAIEKMDNFRINHLPIVRNKKIIGLHTRSNFQKKKKSNILLVMAGGRGKRLMPLTKNKPKPLLKYKRKIVIEYLLKKIKSEGFENVYLSVNYLKEKIKNKIKNGKKYKLDVQYLNEKKPLGTAGSISFLKNKTTKPIIITNCDVITDLKYSSLIDFHQKENSDLTVVIKDYKTQNPFGKIKIEKKKIISIEEKPISFTYINAGIYVLNPSLIKYIPKNKYIDMNDLINKLMNLKKKVTPYLAVDKWYDVSQYLRN